MLQGAVKARNFGLSCTGPVIRAQGLFCMPVVSSDADSWPIWGRWFDGRVEPWRDLVRTGVQFSLAPPYG